MGYLVLARKCRPTQFVDVIGQEHITKTLQNAIKHDRIAHAYLFSGPRGVGKTTTARLLAKALNCQEGPTANPCGVCNACKEIADGTSLEVLEVDGASNNGVDQVRTLTDTIKYNSAKDKYKVYIIDEVHMLSLPAFNALLKNLEEPPPKVVFIFATTEIHKVPETIQSRCQQFVFNLIKYDVITTKLKKIVKEDNFKVEENVFSIIARASGGSMRDAESIFEKIITFCGNDITEENALQALGLVSREMFFKLTEAILDEDTKSCFDIVASVINEGKNLDKFIRETIDFFRNMLFLILVNDSQTKKSKTTEDVRFEDLAFKFREDQFLFIIEILCELQKDLKSSLSPRVIVEIAFVKLSHSRHILPVEQVIKKLHALENRLNTLKTQGVMPVNKPENLPEKKKTEEFNIELISSKWNDFLEYLEHKKSLCRQHLTNCKLINLKEGILSLKFPEASVFSVKILNSDDGKRSLSKELSSFFNRTIHLQIELECMEEFNHYENISEHNEDDIKNPISKLNIDGNEFVDTAFKIFDGNIIDPNKNYQRRS